MELNITWKRTIRIWWAYLWRSLIASLCFSFITVIVSVTIGFIMAANGAARELAQFIAGPIGILAGILVTIIPLKMILGKDFGEFSLVLLKKLNLIIFSNHFKQAPFG